MPLDTRALQLSHLIQSPSGTVRLLPPAVVLYGAVRRKPTVPTLMVNGKADFQAPVETNIQPMFDMLGTPSEHKRLVLLDGGHVPSSTNDVIRHVLDWLDLYLGPVESAAR